MLKEIVKGGITLWISSIFIAALSLIYTPILTRVLGPEGLGAMNLAILMIPWIIAFSSFALEPTTTKLISEFKAKNKSISPLIKGSYLIGILSSSVASLLYFLFADFIAWHVFHDPNLGQYIKIASPLIFLSVLYTITLGILRGLKKFGTYAIFECLHQLFIVVIGIFLVLFLRFGVTGALIALIVSPMVLVLYSLYSFRDNFKNEGKKEIGRIIRFGFWLMIISVVLGFFPTLDRLFLGYFESTEVVGFYVPALTLVTATTFFTTAIRNSMFPFISESYAKRDIENTRRYLEGTLKYSLIALGLFLIPCMALRREIIILLFSDKFVQSIPIFQILLFASLFLTSSAILYTFLVSIGEVKKLLLPIFIVLIISFIMYITLVPILHGIGAAISLIIGYFVLSVAYWLMVRGKLDFSIARVIRLILLISASMILISFFTSNLVVNILLAFIFTAFYIVLLFALNFFDKEEIDFIKERIDELFT